MIENFFILGFLLIAQIYIVLYLTKKYTEKTMISKISELLAIVFIIYATTMLYLKNKVSENALIRITISITILVVLFWVYINVYEPAYLPTERVLNEKSVFSEKLGPRNNTNDDKIFSRYITKDESNFSFEDLYPNYKDSNLVVKEEEEENNSSSTGLKDYSQFNGYDQDHICYNCKCLKKEDGSIYCGKNVPGLGMIGCSPNWKCRNCKGCQKQKYNNKNNNNNNFVKKVSNNTNNKVYECRNCKCYSTMTGNMCGKRGRVSGNIIRCKSHCENCSQCEGSNSYTGNNSSNNLEETEYQVVQPNEELNYDNIIINNISKKDIDDIL